MTAISTHRSMQPSTTPRFTRRALVVGSAGAVLAACTSTTAGTTATETGQSSTGLTGTAAALSLVPSSVNSVQIYDLASAKKRWGLQGVTGESAADDADAVALRKKLTTSVTNSLLIYQELLKDGWNGFDVDAEIALGVDGPPVSVLRMRDGLDLAKVADSLEKGGMKRSGTADAPFFAPGEMGKGAYGKLFLSGVTVIASQHLLVKGPQSSWQAPEMASSLAADASAQQVCQGLGDVDFLLVDVGSAACAGPADVRGGAAASAAASAAAAAGEQPPVSAVAVAMTGENTAVIRTLQASDTDARTAKETRAKLLDSRSPVDGRQYSEIFRATLEVSGPVLSYQITADRPSVLLRMYTSGDRPWASC